ncbi:MAG: TonB-dependent receptor [Acidobacteria bacterium]|nr:TonB-dependent receptor [Acidobacteriota bacterium]
MLRLLFVAAAMVWQAAAQYGSSLQGVVTDPSAAVITGAKVRVTSVQTGVVREATTNQEGLFRVLNLGPGRYSVAAGKDGFRTAEARDIEVAIDQVVRLDLKLQLGPVSESVTVSERQSLIETEEGRISGRVESIQLSELPLNGRNLFNLIALQPGVMGRGISGAVGGGSGNDPFAGEMGPQIYASGQRAEANNYTLDDSNANSMSRGGYTNIIPNADSVQEVRVVSNNFSAVDGRNSGAQIQVITKGGSNQFHGSAAEYFQNNTLSARNLFEKSVPVFRRNQFGYNIGGPIVRNRMFFFHSYEGLRYSGSRARVFSVETPAFRDFVMRTRPNSIAARLLRDFGPVAVAESGFRDLGSPRTGVNSIGPADGIPDIGNVVFAPEMPRNGNQYSGRVDWEAVPGRDRLFTNYYFTRVTYLTGSIRPSSDRPRTDTTHFVSLNHTHIFSAARLNEARFGFMRNYGLLADPKHPEIPTVNVPQVTGWSAGIFPYGFFQNNYQFKDVFSSVQGGHSVKFGGEIRRVHNNTRNTREYIPAYSFANILDFADDEALQMTRSVDPRTGEPATTVLGIRQWEWAFFINDDWKVTHNFSLNAGLRYEHYGAITEANDLLRQLVFGSGSSYSERFANGRADFVQGLFHPSWFDFGPRLGFAWNPGGKRWVVRGGYGLSYDRMFLTGPAPFASNPPMRASAVLGQLYGTTFTYALGDSSKPHLGYPTDPGLRLGLGPKNGMLGARVTLRGFDPNLKPARSQNWFFAIQRELPHGWVAEMSYLGSTARHLESSSNRNRYRGDMLDKVFNGLNDSFGNITITESGSNSIHQGGTFSIRRPFRGGLTIQAAYTFGKTITDADEGYQVTNFIDADDRRLNRAVADFDAPQKLALTGVWEMPFFASARGPVAAALKGWQLSGFAILQKGLPLTVTETLVWPRGDYNADNQTGDRPNAPSESVRRSGWTKTEFLTGILRASDFPLPVRGMNGNLGRNTFRGPGFAQVDAAVSKQFKITERVTARLSLDAFNALNRVNLNSPAMSLSNNNFGKSTSTLTPRQTQIGLRFRF